MTDILLRLVVILVSAVILGGSIPRIYFGLKAERAQLRKWVPELPGCKKARFGVAQRS